MNKEILIVDDSVDFLNSLRKLLELYQYKVHSCSSGREAIDLLSKNNFDIVLSDLHIPEIDGIELLERIKHTVNADIPVILMARYITVDKTLELIRSGAADFIKKPFDDYQVVKTVSRQSNKAKKNPYQYLINEHLIGKHYCFEFSPQDFISINISDFLVNHISSIKEIIPSICNELSLCLEEIVSNAFIHGTFGLGCSYKELNNEQYTRFISQLLKRPSIANKRVYVNISYRRINDTISISVTDQGTGFNHKDTAIDGNNLFRGLGLISVLCDKVSYSNDGRTVRIEKKIAKRSVPGIAINLS